jgi:hypothetical protein
VRKRRRFWGLSSTNKISGLEASDEWLFISFFIEASGLLLAVHNLSNTKA